MKFKTERLEIKKPGDEDKLEIINGLKCWEVCTLVLNIRS